MIDYIKEHFSKALNPDSNLYEQFMTNSETRSLSRKNIYLKEGQVCKHLGIVESGILRSYLIKDTEEYTSDFYFPGSIIGSYRSFLTGEKSSGYIEALEESKIRLISKADFENLLQTTTYGYKWGKYISDTLFIKKCRKETSLLMNSAKERYNLLLHTYPSIEQKVSQKHIASYLGIKPESLSRIKRLNIG